MNKSKWIPLSNIKDDEEIWAGARVRLYDVGLNSSDKEKDYYEFIISYIYDNNDHLQLTNLTPGKAGYVTFVLEKDLPNNFGLGKTLKYLIGLENAYIKFEFE